MDMSRSVKTRAEDLAKEIDDKVLSFFGSEEAVKTYGHLYVLEQTPMRIETWLAPELSADYFTMRTEVKYRIRPKTMAELEEDRRD